MRKWDGLKKDLNPKNGFGRLGGNIFEIGQAIFEIQKLPYGILYKSEKDEN